VVLFI